MGNANKYLTYRLAVSRRTPSSRPAVATLRIVLGTVTQTFALMVESGPGATLSCLVSLTADQVTVSVLAKKRRRPTFGGQPGRQRTIGRRAPFVSFACRLALLGAGHGGLLDVVIDGIGLVTLRIGEGLIGGAATAKMTEEKRPGR
jgi:hypothetical protein